jgi:protein-S-isoprenylcysteine O-methyltransferase Ste14
MAGMLETRVANPSNCSYLDGEVESSMPKVALAGFIVFGFLAFGLRAWVHYRRTGTSGFVGLSGEFGSMEWLGGALFVVTLVAGVAAPILQINGTLTPSAGLEGALIRATGLALYAAGVAGTLWAQFAMGDSWRIGVDASARTNLVATGPFLWVRNPIYSAMMIAMVGLALLAPNALSLLAVLALVIGLEIHVRVVEEPYLARTHGADYLGYAARTGRFLPGIGRMTAIPSEQRG